MSIATAKRVYKMAQKIKHYYEVDQRKRIVFTRALYLGRYIGDVPDFECPDFSIVDGKMTIYPTGDREPFCDGASLAPDELGKLRFIKAAAGHDAIYSQLENIAAAWHWSVEDVRKLADDMFGDLLVAEAERAGGIWSPIGKLVAHIYHGAVRLFGGVYHNAKKGADLLILCIISALALSVGCAWEPVFEASDEEPLYFATNLIQKIETPKNEDKKPTPAPEKQPSADAIDYSLLDWCYGGFNGANAKHLPSVIIKNLRVKSNGLSYAWQSGNCEALGASGHTNADCIAALFCLVDGKWVGGKFDWISTSRLTRDFANIDGYNGWSRSVFNAAKKYAFVIVSRDGRTRSNVIVSE